LKLVGANEQKGPGEFALAALSPDISIFGSGDLKIGNQNIEVKAAAGEKSTKGGRLGSTGFLQHQRVAAIINSYMPEGFKVNPNENLNLREFEQLLKKANFDPATLGQFATELFGYIFEGKDWADISPLVNAMVNGSDLYKPYTIVSYNAYRGRPENTKFDGVMLMSFPLQELKYYDDPEKMYDDLYTPGIKLISANKEFASRLIVPSVGLRPEKVERVEKIKVKGKQVQEVKDWAVKYADYIVKLNRNRTPGLANDIEDFIMDLFYKKKFSNLNQKIYSQFPGLKKNDSADNEETPDVDAEPDETAEPVEPTPAEVPASIQNQTRTLGNKIPMGSR
jgi:hypothetical protein